MKAIWKCGGRDISLEEKVLVMGILNVTPDSFSDGGKFLDVDFAVDRASLMISEGADIIDVGGESTRPNGKRISVDKELERVIPVIAALNARFDLPISIDTNKSEVASAAVESGAAVINDISGLKFDEKIAEVAAKSGCGLILMHLRGDFESMHILPKVEKIVPEVVESLQTSIKTAENYGVSAEQICLDPGIGFGKTVEQNFELIAKIAQIKAELNNFPILIGASRKSFIGKVLDELSPERRAAGSLAVNVLSAINGASILRVHDVKETVDAIKMVETVRKQS